MFYARNLINSVDKNAIRERNFKILVDTGSQFVDWLFRTIAKDLDCSIDTCDGNIIDAIHMDDYDFAIKLDANCEMIQLYSNSGQQVKDETMVALVSLICMKQDKTVDVVIPYTAPTVIERMAKAYQSNVVRSKTKRQAMMEEVIRIGDSDTRKTIERFQLYFDGLATIIGIMDLMAKENSELTALIEDIPKIYMSSRDIECPWTAKGRIMRTLIDNANKDDSHIELYEGIKINRDKGWALILPDPDEPLVRIYAEGTSEEYAEELSDFYEREIYKIKD